MNRGFTLMETVVVVSITAVVGVGLLAMISYFYRSNAYVLEGVTALESARRGLSESFGALREASYGEDGSYPIAGAATSSVTFYSEIDGDSAIEKVRLYLSGTTFYAGITNPGGAPQTYSGQPEATRTIATDVKNATSTPLFRYFDAQGTELPVPIDLASVRSVRVRLDVDVNPLRAPNILMLEETATMRNVR